MDQKQSKPKSKIMKLNPGPIKISVTRQQPWTDSNNSAFKTPEPISPKVSCIGRIKNKKKTKQPAKITTAAVKISDKKKRRPPSGTAMTRILTGGKVNVKEKSNVAAAAAPVVKPPLPKRSAPRLSQMKRFTSGRGPLASFDWTAQIAPADVEGEELEEVWIGEEVGPLQPRKEINIWKRRTVVPPPSLQLQCNTVVQK